MKSRFGSLLVVASALAVFSHAPAAVSAQEKITLKYLTAWDDRADQVHFIAYRYGKMVEKATQGRINFRYSGPEVIKSRQQFQPTTRGVFDMNLSVAPYYVGTTAVTMPFFAMPPDVELWRREGYWDVADKEMQRYNQKLISHVVGGTKTDVFQLILKQPVGKDLLKGRKIRANGFYKPIVEPLGGSMVNLNGPDIYSALQKGVVEGAAWPVIGAVNFKWYEVAKYMMRPRFGVSPFTVTMNMDRWKKFSKADQELLLKIGRELEQTAPAIFDKKTNEEIAELKKLGVKETWLDKETFAPIDAGFRSGVWDFAESFKGTKKRVQAFRAMARAKGHAE